MSQENSNNNKTEYVHFNFALAYTPRALNSKKSSHLIATRRSRDQFLDWLMHRGCGSFYAHTRIPRGFRLPSASLILRPTADLRSTLLPELKRLASSSRGLDRDLLLGGL